MSVSAIEHREPLTRTPRYRPIHQLLEARRTKQPWLANQTRSRQPVLRRPPTKDSSGAPLAHPSSAGPATVLGTFSERRTLARHATREKHRAIPIGYPLTTTEAYGTRYGKAAQHLWRRPPISTVCLLSRAGPSIQVLMRLSVSSQS